MISELNNFLSTSQDSLGHCQSIGVSESNADSGFLIHNFVSYFLKSHRKVYLLSLCQTFTHYNTVGNKLGSNLTEERKKCNLVFIEGLNKLGPLFNLDQNLDNEWRGAVDDGGKLNLKVVYEIIKSIILMGDESLAPVFLIDNLNVLLDVGVPVKDLIVFFRYMQNLICRLNNGCLIVGVNNDCGQEDEDASLLWKVLQYSTDMNIEVRGLASGYCRDVHGQINVRWSSSNVREKPTSREAQFKLTDKNCSLFAAGLSSAVL